jgi:hypothetical protein
MKKGTFKRLHTGHSSSTAFWKRQAVRTKIRSMAARRLLSREREREREREDNQKARGNFPG